MAGPSHKKAAQSVRAAKSAAKRRWMGALGTVALLGSLAMWVLWIAIHRITWLGPWLADTGRTLIGSAAVSGLENFAYDSDDRWNRFWRRNEAPRAHWSIPDPPAKPGSEASSGDAAAEEDTGVPLCYPTDVGT